MSCCWLSREHVHTCRLYISTCAPIVDLDNLLNVLAFRYEDSLSASPYIFRPMFFHITSMYVMECNTYGLLCPINLIQLSATDLLALASMKNAAKCDK